MDPEAEPSPRVWLAEVRCAPVASRALAIVIRTRGHARSGAHALAASRRAAQLNEANFLGSGGKVARSFVELLRAIWYGEDAAVSPTAFKRTLAEFSPMFEGYQQHDAQVRAGAGGCGRVRAGAGGAGSA